MAVSYKKMPSETLNIGFRRHFLPLNYPRVVGRFFRAAELWFEVFQAKVLIPMWWGGFSETQSL